jgi:hypothetical protein
MKVFILIAVVACLAFSKWPPHGVIVPTVAVDAFQYPGHP